MLHGDLWHVRSQTRTHTHTHTLAIRGHVAVCWKRTSRGRQRRTARPATQRECLRRRAARKPQRTSARHGVNHAERPSQARRAGRFITALPAQASESWFLRLPAAGFLMTELFPAMSFCLPCLSKRALRMNVIAGPGSWVLLRGSLPCSCFAGKYQKVVAAWTSKKFRVLWATVFFST